MKKLLLTAFGLAISPMIGWTQVTLTQSQAPALNSVIIYNDANVPSPPFTFSKSGTGNQEGLIQRFACVHRPASYLSGAFFHA